ncbi:MAG: hypothetical protein DWQ04_13325 [Chloroflexi bacterium]|nr:MAG: hypothetical protein DWQ04_13325 [Chloroflexota bacterium]
MWNQMKIANLDKTAVNKVQTLEKEFGTHVMAFETGVEFARLTREQIDKVAQLEKELGVTLLVYKE